MRLTMVCSLATVLLGFPALGADAPKPYSSPYAVKFQHSEKELLKDILESERGDPEAQSRIPFEEWVGAIGGVNPLILDSTGTGHKDSRANPD